MKILNIRTEGIPALAQGYMLLCAHSGAARPSALQSIFDVRRK